MRRVPHHSRGSITLVALCLAVVIGISLASYLALCQQSLRLSTRTMHLDRARLLAETGLEEALWSLNIAAHPTSTTAAIAWTNATWTTTGLDKSCTISGYNLGNGATGTLTLTIANFGGPSANTTLPSPTITAVATVSVPGFGDFTKTLVATTKPAPLFANAIGVLSGSLTLPNGTRIDSWDSDYNAAAIAPTPTHDYNYSATSPVPYALVTPVAPDLINPLNCNAAIAAPNIILAGDAAIDGYAMTNGSAISSTINNLIKGPTTPSATKIDPARVGKSTFIPTYPIITPTPPSGFWTNLPANAAWGATQSIGAANTITYYTTNTAESGMSGSIVSGPGNDLFLDGSKTLEITGHVILLINEDFELRNNAKIIINAGSQLEIICHDDLVISDTAGFQNDPGEPKNLALYCTSQYSGNFTGIYSSTADFTGVIYTMDNNEGLSITSSPVISGALLCGYTPTFTGAPIIHYDTALQYLPRKWFLGVATPFLVVQITES